MMVGRPRISLAMIVRDEAHQIKECLSPWIPVVDEIVVVDTGSKDDTAKIASSLGAKVIYAEWRDSFAEARNVSLENASGDWILWMDADDRIDSGQLDNFCNLMGRFPDAQSAYTMKVHSTVSGSSTLEVSLDQVRLFPRQTGVRWKYRVYEQIIPSLHQAGLNLKRTNIEIQHTGYSDENVWKEKVRRNLRLLHMDLSEYPNDPFIFFNLGNAEIAAGKIDEGIMWYRRCIETLPNGDPLSIRVSVFLAENYFKTGDIQRSLTTCRTALSFATDAHDVHRCLGILYLELKDWSRAAIHFSKSLQPACDVVDSFGSRSFDHLRALNGHAMALSMLRRWSEAERAWQRYRLIAPNDLPACLCWSDAALLSGNAEKVEAFLQDRTISASIRRLIRARLHFAKRENELARRLLEPLVKESPLIPAQLMLAQIYEESGEKKKAKAILEFVVRIDPKSDTAKEMLAKLDP